jgi:hypothetical protein
LKCPTSIPSLSLSVKLILPESRLSAQPNDLGLERLSDLYCHAGQAGLGQLLEFGVLAV